MNRSQARTEPRQKVRTRVRRRVKGSGERLASCSLQPLLTHADDDVGPRDFREEAFYLAHRDLPVGRCEKDPVAARVTKAGRHCSRETSITLVPYDSDVSELFRESIDDRPGPITAAVIDDQDLGVAGRDLLRRGSRLANGTLDVLDLVESRDRDGEEHARGLYGSIVSLWYR